jgi:hypothetical protein
MGGVRIRLHQGCILIEVNGQRPWTVAVVQSCKRPGRAAVHVLTTADGVLPEIREVK